MSSPEKIFELNREYNRTMRLIDTLRRHVEYREAKIWLRIVAERDGTKPRYSNEESRRAAYELAKGGDEPWRRRHQAQLTGENRRRALLAEIERERGKFRERMLEREEVLAAHGGGGGRGHGAMERG